MNVIFITLLFSNGLAVPGRTVLTFKTLEECEKQLKYTLYESQEDRSKYDDGYCQKVYTNRIRK